MANPKGSPQNLKRVPKGGPSPNPAGRPKDLFNSQLKKLSANELEEIANIIVKGNVAELKAVAKDPNATVIKTMLASVAVKIISRGDMNAMDRLLDRLLGKVRDNVNVKHTGVTPINTGGVTLNLIANGTEAKEKK